ncbi:MAG: hypothetical protein J6C96_05170 [Oscillospiraceae bacterium]|nr:hypothetical protein [Oscillospiraceae bacterium]
MNDDGILEAERRVREMNNMTRQYSMQGNRFLQNMQNMQNSQNGQNTQSTQNQQNMQGIHNTLKPRFEPAPNSRVMQENRTFRGNGAPRFETGNQQKQGAQNHAPNRESKPDRQTPVQQSDTRQTGFDLSKFNLDSEKLMIIALMYLLIKEKADIKLVLALGYLLF